MTKCSGLRRAANLAVRRAAWGALRSWRFGMGCGGRSRRNFACRQPGRTRIGVIGSDPCKARWQPSSENFGGLVPGCILGNQEKQLCEHLSQRGFTRQRDLERDVLHRRARRFDRAGFRFGLVVGQPGEFHHLRRVNAPLRQNCRDLPGQIKREPRLLEAVRVFKIAVSRVTDTQCVRHRPDSERGNR